MGISEIGREVISGPRVATCFATATALYATVTQTVGVSAADGGSSEGTRGKPFSVLLSRPDCRVGPSLLASLAGSVLLGAGLRPPAALSGS